MKSKSTTDSPAFAFVAAAWSAIPGGSYERLNHGMYSALQTAIASRMKFEEDDIVKIGAQFRAHRWITSGGEMLYVTACGGERGKDNNSAAIALEKWLRRPAYLWAERSRTAERLYVGAQFTWQGHYVTVTSISAESLVACTYKGERDRSEKKIGGIAYAFNEYRRIEALCETQDGTIMARLSAKVPNESATVAKRFTITFEELKAKRKEFDTQRKAYIAEMEAATTLDALNVVNAAVSAKGARAFRHFDIEELQDAYRKAHSRIREGMSDDELAEHRQKESTESERDLQRWLAGEHVHVHHQGTVRLRIREGWVETTNGQSATLKGARTALAFIQKHRKTGWSANGATFDLDHYPLHRITTKGVQVGCTFIEWPEIDRITPLLNA